MLHGHVVCLKEESVCEHGPSLGMVPYDIHSILFLLVIRHPNLVSLPGQEPLAEWVTVHITPLVVDQLVMKAWHHAYGLDKTTY